MNGQTTLCSNWKYFNYPCILQAAPIRQSLTLVASLRRFSRRAAPLCWSSGTAAVSPDSSVLRPGDGPSTRRGDPSPPRRHPASAYRVKLLTTSTMGSSRRRDSAPLMTAFCTAPLVLFTHMRLPEPRGVFPADTRRSARTHRSSSR